MVGFDPLGRPAIGAASLVMLKERLPLREREVSSSGSDAPLVAGDANVGTCSLEIPQTPLFVVIEGCARIQSVFASVSLSLARAQLVSVLDVVTPLVFAPRFAVALIPSMITTANAFCEPWITRISLAFRGKNRVAVGRVSLAVKPPAPRCAYCVQFRSRHRRVAARAMARRASVAGRFLSLSRARRSFRRSGGRSARRGRGSRL